MNPTNPINNALVAAFYKDHMHIVKLIASHPRTDLQCLDDLDYSRLSKEALDFVYSQFKADGITRNQDAANKVFAHALLNSGRTTIFSLMSIPYINWKNLDIIMSIPGNQMDILKGLMRHRANPGAWNNAAIVYAARYNREEPLRMLLRDSRVNPNDNGGLALVEAIRFGYQDIVEILLDSPRVNPSVGDNHALYMAIKVGNNELVQRLMEDPRVRTILKDSPRCVLCLAAELKLKDTMRLLLSYKNDFSSKQIGDALVIAAKNGFTNTAGILVKEGDANVAHVNNAPIRLAAKNGHESVVERLLKDKRVNPGANHNEALISASEQGYENVVRLLLHDPRVNPSDQENKAFLAAAKNGHLSIVYMLTKFQTVTHSPQIQTAIRLALENGHLQVFETIELFTTTV